MGFMGKIKVGVRVYTGFFLVLLVMAVVAWMGYSSLQGAGGRFDQYADVSKNSARVLTIDRNVVGLRRNVYLFTDNGNEKALARVRELQKILDKDISDAIAVTRDPGRKKMLDEAYEVFKAYSANFDKAEALRKSVGLTSNDGLQGVMRNAVQELEGKLREQKKTDLTAQMLELRRDEKDFQLRADEKYLKEHEAGAARLSEALARDPSTADLAKLVAAYEKAFKEMAEGTQAMNKMVGETMAGQAGQFAKLIADVTVAQSKFLDELDASLEREAASATRTMIVVSLVGLVLGLFLAWLIASGIVNPVAAMTRAMTRLAGGDKTVEIPAQGNTDEIGDMAKAVQVFKENAIKVDRMQAEQEEMKRQAEREKKIAMNKMADDFQASVGGIVQAVSSASTEMQSSAQSLSATAEQTSRQATTVAAAAEQASTNVQTVASATEELSSSISEITRQVAKSTEITGRAVKEAEHTHVQVQGLAHAAQKIGEVVSLITDIAEQTNLLALNATIEAARAGEAGKGFAVVASEVKNLANQTAKATDEISNQITGIQQETQQAVTAIDGIGKIITEVNQIATAIASAVEEQGAATQEIARNVEQASAGTTEVTANISGVSQAASETGNAATQMLGAAGELAKNSDTLKREVEKFLNTVRQG